MKLIFRQTPIKMNNKYKIYAKILQFIIIGILPFVVNRELLSTELLVGRFIDFSTPTDSTLLQNAFEWPFKTWINTVNYGARTGFPLTLIPNHIILYLPFSFTDSVWMLVRWQLIIPLYITSFGFLFLYKSINNFYGKETHSVLNTINETAFALLFTYSSYYLSELSYGSFYLILSFAGIPYTLGFFIKYINSRVLLGYVAPAFALCVAGAAIQFLVITIILMMVIAVAHNKINYYIKVMVMYVALALYWIIPLTYSLLDVAANEVGSSGIVNLNGLHISDVLLGRDYYGGRMIYEKMLGDGIIKFLPSFSFIGILILSLMFFRRNETADYHTRRIGSLMLISGLIATFMVKGNLPPFGIVNELLYANIKIMVLFRSIQRFIPIIVICSSVLVALSLVNKKSYTKTTILIISLFLGSLPWWITGDLGSKELKEIGVMSRVSTFERTNSDELISKIQNEFGDFNILTNPPSNSINFHDSLSQGGDSDFYHGNKGYFSSESAKGSLKTTIDQLEFDMYTNTNFLIDNSEILYDLGIKYFIVRKNTSPLYTKYKDIFNPYVPYNTINGKHKLIFNDSSVSIYRITDWRSLFYLNGLQKKCVSGNNGKNKSNSPVDVSDFINLAIKDITYNCPIIKYRKISSTEYEVDIQGAKNLVKLGMNNSYHSFWTLTPVNLGKNENENENGNENIDEAHVTHHSGLNNLNYWNIDVKNFCNNISNSCIERPDGTSSLSVRVTFIMQSWAYYSLALSGIFWLMSLVYVLWYNFGVLRKKKVNSRCIN